MVTYLDTFGDGGYSYADYVGWCQDNGIEPAEEDSHLHLDWVQQSLADDVECFFENLKYEKGIVQDPCIVTGTLGLWWGHPEIEPTECEDLASAVSECCRDCDYFKVTGEDGVIHIEAAHHDGTNCFEIRPKDGRAYPKYLF